MARKANEQLYDSIVYLMDENEDYKEAWINYRIAVFQDNKKRMDEAQFELTVLEQERVVYLKTRNPL